MAPDGEVKRWLPKAGNAFTITGFGMQDAYEPDFRRGRCGGVYVAEEDFHDDGRGLYSIGHARRTDSPHSSYFLQAHAEPYGTVQQEALEAAYVLGGLDAVKDLLEAP